MIKFILLMTLLVPKVYATACGRLLIVDLKLQSEKFDIDGKTFKKEKEFCSEAKHESNANYEIVLTAKDYTYRRKFYLTKRVVAETLNDKKELKIAATKDLPAYRQFRLPIDKSVIDAELTLQVIDLSNDKVVFDSKI